ncbi:hypothetical protein B0H13DRAFT_427948 [Mycena leptocephala]|nr:hypothetical protein B0H13DRAFT_427948 [Mycena leptocephala]
MRPSAKARTWTKQQERARSRRRTKKSEIASICLFLDPRPADGVYAAFGMESCASSQGNSPVASPMALPVGSAVGSPVLSPIVPSFAAAMEASSTFASAGHVYASPTVRTFGEVMQWVAEAVAISSFVGFQRRLIEGMCKVFPLRAENMKGEKRGMCPKANATRTRTVWRYRSLLRQLRLGRVGRKEGAGGGESAILPVFLYLPWDYGPRVALTAFRGVPCVSLVRQPCLLIAIFILSPPSSGSASAYTASQAYPSSSSQLAEGAGAQDSHAALSSYIAHGSAPCAVYAQGRDAGVGKRWGCEVVRGGARFEWGPAPTTSSTTTRPTTCRPPADTPPLRASTSLPHTPPKRLPRF